MASVCVLGGGPAGSTFAARMAQLGHDVDLIESAVFPRAHLGESLSPGVLPLLATTGADTMVMQASFRPIRQVMVSWEEAPRLREDRHEQGLLVDRGRFDKALLDRARALGVRVLQPARIIDRQVRDGAWTVTVEAAGEVHALGVDFLADARGRAAAGGWRKRATGPSTLALYAYWQGDALPHQPTIEAGPDAWYWGVPLPDGTYNSLAFVDARQFQASGSGPLVERFLRLLARSSLGAGLDGAQMTGPVRAIDATPYVADAAVTRAGMAIGETALAIDPISSSGVQKALQSALAGAIVANTLLRLPSSASTAMAFYGNTLREASVRHSQWAASHYATAAALRPSAFWRVRARSSAPDTTRAALPQPDAEALSTWRVEVSRELAIENLPCIEGDLVVLKPALRHPELAAPVAYLGDHALVPLIRSVRPGATPLEIAEAWSAGMPLKTALSIAVWLLNAGILVECRRLKRAG